VAIVALKEASLMTRGWAKSAEFTRVSKQVNAILKEGGMTIEQDFEYLNAIFKGASPRTKAALSRIEEQLNFLMSEGYDTLRAQRDEYQRQRDALKAALKEIVEWNEWESAPIARQALKEAE
jgi:polyhydroxyalkanoate synthesis regulator phasin